MREARSDNALMTAPRAGRLAPLLAALVACTPTFDWREVRIDAGSLQAVFPCRPQHRTREVKLGGSALRMEMSACTADESTFALSFVDASGPGQVAPVLDDLRRAASGNLGATLPVTRPFSPERATPNAASGRLRIEGRLPDGKPVVEHSVFFIRGLRIYQASVIGGAPDAEAVEIFFAGLKLAP
jgi:hypothetical protein